MKHSRYNYITPEKDGFFLLFNTAKETLVELDAEMLNYCPDRLTKHSVRVIFSLWHRERRSG